MAASGILRVMEGGHLGFWCPGCREMHVVHSGWQFNGNYDRPTFSPSILVTGGHYAAGREASECWCTYNAKHPEDRSQFKCARCHSYVVDGRIQFLDDCSHALAGQTVPLEVPNT